MKYIQRATFIVLAYVLCFGLTNLLVMPVQRHYLDHVSFFAALVYLPHGVRVLATWLYGWRAVPPLFVGVAVSYCLFTPTEVFELLQPMLLESLLVGSISALAAFELMRLFGRNLYANQPERLNWQGILFIGALSSVLNSIGQSWVYSGLIVPEQVGLVLLSYAIGDLMGVAITMFALMMIFRWVRLTSRRNA